MAYRKDRSARKQRGSDSNFHKGLVFMACYLVMFLHTGLFYSIGAIFVDVMSTFNATRAQTAVIHSTAMAVGLGSGLMIGLIIHRFGIVRCGLAGASVASFGIILCYLATSIVHMTISIGIIYALGFSCLYISSTIAIGQHFSGDRKLLVMSIQATGAALGGMVYPYILIYLSDIYGFRGALLIIGGVCMNCIPVCLLWRQHIKAVTLGAKGDTNNAYQLQKYQEALCISVKTTNDEITIEKNKNMQGSYKSDIFYIDKFPVIYNDLKTRRISIEEKDDTSDSLSETDNEDQSHSLLHSIKSILSNKSFIIFVVGCVIANPSLGIVVIFVADVFIDKGLTIQDVTFGLLLMNIVNIIGRLLPGAMLQWKKIPTFFCPLLATTMATVVLVGFSLSSSRGVTIAVLCVAGIPIGMFITMFSVVTTKLVGTKNLPTAIGLIFTLNGVGNAVAGPVSGYVRDSFGSYTVPFYSAAAMTTVAMLIFMVAMASQIVMKNRQRRRTSSVFYLTSM